MPAGVLRRLPRCARSRRGDVGEPVRHKRRGALRNPAELRQCGDARGEDEQPGGVRLGGEGPGPIDGAVLRRCPTGGRQLGPGFAHWRRRSRNRPGLSGRQAGSRPAQRAQMGRAVDPCTVLAAGKPAVRAGPGERPGQAGLAEGRARLVSVGAPFPRGYATDPSSCLATAAVRRMIPEGESGCVLRAAAPLDIGTRPPGCPPCWRRCRPGGHLGSPAAVGIEVSGGRPDRANWMPVLAVRRCRIDDPAGRLDGVAPALARRGGSADSLRPPSRHAPVCPAQAGAVAQGRDDDKDASCQQEPARGCPQAAASAAAGLRFSMSARIRLDGRDEAAPPALPATRLGRFGPSIFKCNPALDRRAPEEVLSRILAGGRGASTPAPRAAGGRR